MPFCRLVVLPEESYQELRSAACIEPSEPDPSVQPASPKREDTPPLPRASSVPPPSPPHSPAKEDTWPDKALPPAYRKEGQAFLQRLIDQGLEVRDSGRLSLEGVDLGNFGVVDLLRVTCIPRNRGPLPLRLQEWLKAKKITDFRNHKKVLLPTWKKRYSLRSSTRAPTLERFVAQRNLKNKLKKPDI